MRQGSQKWVVSEEREMNYRREYTREKVVSPGLSKDIVNKKLTGVCAGIARHYEYPRVVVRAAAIGALIFLPVATGVAYVVASALLPSQRAF